MFLKIFMSGMRNFSFLWTILRGLLCIAFVAGQQQQRPRDVTDPDQMPNMLYLNTVNFSGESRSIQQDYLDRVFLFLLRNTPSHGYATCLGYGDPPHTVFAHTACYDGNTNCLDCLTHSYNLIAELYNDYSFPSGYRFWQVDNVSYKCNTRYELQNFTQGLPSDTLGILGPNNSADISPSPSKPENNPVLPPAHTSTGSTGSKKTGGSRKTGIIVGAVGGISALFFISGIFIWKTRRGSSGDELQGATRGAPIVFSYKQLSSTTGNFAEHNKLGEGGFGPVYKAVLANGTHLAVKKHSIKSRQGKKEFINEISIITGIQHKNLVKLVGYCAEGNHRLLVYEFLENSSLDRHLFGSGETLAWEARFQIVFGVAKGIAYLHEESHEQIIHRDIKASNILLDKTLQPKISDFGLSKLIDITKEDTSTNLLAGTLGYMAPEYVIQGRLSSKADVYSFGILVLEVVSGRKCIDPSDQENPVQKIWRLYNAGKIEELVDPRLNFAYVAEEAQRLMHVAILCTQESEDHRPVMSAVVSMLTGHPDVQPLDMLQPPNHHVSQWARIPTNTVPVLSQVSYDDQLITVPEAR